MSMRIHTSAPAPLLLLLGCAFLAGAAVLAWFSAVVTLQLTRHDTAAFTAQLETRLFGLVPVAHTQIDGVRAVEFIDFRLQDSRSRSHAQMRLIFQTRAGAVDAGYAQQQFAQRGTEVREFLEQAQQQQLRLASSDGFHEGFRFFAAQAVVLLLAALGVLLLALGLQPLYAALFSRET